MNQPKLPKMLFPLSGQKANNNWIWNYQLTLWLRFFFFSYNTEYGEFQIYPVLYDNWLFLTLFYLFPPKKFTQNTLQWYIIFTFKNVFSIYVLNTGCPDQIGRNFKTTLLNNQNTCRKCEDSFGIVRNRAIIYVFG